MSFEELGLVFRQERERRGLSIEEVAGRLKLMPRIVRAIEQADIEELPQAVYARGFVKAYGTLLEFDPESLHAGVEDAWPDDFQQSPLSCEPAGGRKSAARGRLATCAVLALILAVGIALWFFRDLEPSLPSGVLPKAEPAISAKSGVPTPPTQDGDTPPARDKDQSAARQADSLPIVAVSAVPAQTVPPVAPADSRKTEPLPDPAPQATPSPAAPQGGRHNLIIVALAECWVHSNADSTDTRQFSLRKGDTFALTFGKKLVLKLGNAGGVRIRLDGRELDPPGEPGQVKTLTFPANL